MARYLITLHTYGSWLADRKEGWTDRRKSGTMRTSHELGDWQRAAMSKPEEALTHPRQRLAIAAAEEAAARRDFALYTVGSWLTHLHALVGVVDARDPGLIRRALKRSISHTLSDRAGVGLPFLSGGGGITRVSGRKKFEFFRELYLPDHPGWLFDSRTGLRPPS